MRFFRRRKTGADYYFERGEECLKNGNYRWAVESFTKAIEFNPSFEMAYYGRAEAYGKLGENWKAIKDYVKFLETDVRGYEDAEEPKDVLPAVWKNAKLNLQRHKAKDEIRSYGALNIVEKLIKEYDPNKSYSHRNLYKLLLSDLKKSYPERKSYIGFIELLRGNLEKAVKAFDEAIREDLENPDLHYFKGVALLKKTEDLKKGSAIRRDEKVNETWQRAKSSLMAALQTGSWSLCPECGYRTQDPKLTFCMHCGKKLARPS